MPRLSFHASAPRAIVSSLALLCVGALGEGQAIARPQPTCIRNVSLDRSGESDHLHTLLLRDGRIEAILAADAEVPPGMRIVDGEGRLCLPAFVDAYRRGGHTNHEPVVDQDLPVDVGAGVRVDMRLANRKGIQPAFRAAEALALEASDVTAHQEAGFGAAMISPGGQLLGGTTCLATLREAAMRDVVLSADVFASAAFQASGPGYPSTLMGYTAQLRQFFLDAERHVELTQRRADGRPGPRPAFDAELAAGASILSGERRVLCEAETHRDAERWLKLADEVGFEVAFAGGRDLWRVADLLAERDVPVVMTLDWGKEVDDPRPSEDEDEDEDADEDEAAEEGAAEGDDDAAEASEETQEPEESGEVEDEPVWEYTEPLGVRLARRLEWEETRDSALRLHEAGVRIAFGSGTEKPDKLLDRVRTLVEEGLPAEVALDALTGTPASLMGVGDRLGSLAAGQDATLVLWSADPLTAEKAKPVWVFVDGFPTEFEAPDEDATPKGVPDEGVTASGRWLLTVQDEDGQSEMQLELEMEPEGAVTGELFFESPMDESEMSIEVEGHVTGAELTLEGVMDFGDFRMDFAAEMQIDEDAISGEFTYSSEFFPEPRVRDAEGTREPEAFLEEAGETYGHGHDHLPQAN